MRHAPTLLYCLVLASTPLARAAADAPHHGANRQRLARLETPPSRESDDSCLSMIADDPAGAADAASTWAQHGGADRAARCGALAAVALGDPESGARTLDGLSRTATLAGPRRALMADEAARAWLLAGKPDLALASSGLAVSLDPTADHAIEHGRAALAVHRPELAIADLSPVLAAHPDRADALIVRASAFRQQGALDRASSDIEIACRLQPDSPEALLERGILRERQGDLDGARADWSRILSIAPDTHEADLAQQDLALLDAGPEAR